MIFLATGITGLVLACYQTITTLLAMADERRTTKLAARFDIEFAKAQKYLAEEDEMEWVRR